jgi:hypothetical protein
MMFEISLYGVLFPSLLVSAVLAALCVALLRAFMGGAGLYRAVWHPALFDLAVFVLLLAGIDRLVSGS